MHYEKFADGSMKCIEDAIQFELPKGWRWVRLGTVYEHSTGKALNSSNAEGVMLTYITTSNLYWDRFELDSIKEMPFTDAEIDKYTVKKGDLLVCEGGDIGRSAIWNYDDEIRIQNHIHRLRSYVSLSNRFYYYVLYLWKKQERIGGQGIGLQSLSSKALHKILVPLPPTNEQQNIVDKLDYIFNFISDLDIQKDDFLSLVDLTKSKILDLGIQGKLVPQNPEDEPASMLLERIRSEKEELIRQGKIKRDKKESVIFKGGDNSYYEIIDNKTICIDEEIPFDLPASWIWCRLKSLAAPHENSFVDGPFGSNLKTDHYTENREVRIIQLNNIGEFTWKNSGVKYTTYRHAELLERCKSYPGDIVIAKMMPAGRTIIIPDIEDAYVISSDCVRLQLPEYIDNEYIMFMINSPTINAYILKYVQGIGRTRTSLGKLKELLIPLPPYNQQVHISMFFKKVFNYFDVI